MYFSVAVFTEPGGKSVEELLAPYQNEKWDNLCNGCRGFIPNNSAVMLESSFCTFAVLTPDGKWYQQGQASNECYDEDLDWILHYKERFIDQAKPDWALTVIDCHI